MERERESVEFRKDLVSKLLHMYLEEKTKVSGDAVLLLMELLKVFVHETAYRAARQAQSEEVSVVNIEHVEKVLPQLLLDF
ncbi:centromere protein X [Dendropsophus ebraccatus]|uniref:centromere protein X n=1 Tax=Dendropsophus ebraccatus TaxID=150705 RepID=UPI00383107EF